MSAIAALPNFHLRPFEYLCSLDILQKCAVTFLVTLFNGSYTAEFCSELREAFLLSCLCKTCIHICPFVVLAGCCVCEILCCVTDAVKFLEPEFCVLLLVIGGLKEEGCDLLESLFLCL